MIERRKECNRIGGGVLVGVLTAIGCNTEGVAPIAPVNDAAETLVLDLGDGVAMEFVAVAGGIFSMGSDVGDGDERPAHDVAIGRSFFVGRTEVTQSQWRTVMRTNPSGFVGDDLPVESVSWEDATAFTEALSALTARTVRLPTEAEWEYACRAGTTTVYSFGDTDGAIDANAWYSENSGATTHAVGEKFPNAFGLFDTHGNVWEWCADWYAGGYYSESPMSDPPGPTAGTMRVIRGGAIDAGADLLRSASRSFADPQLRLNNIGFRVVVE